MSTTFKILCYTCFLSLLSCTAGRILVFNQPSVEDLKHFPANKITAAPSGKNPFVEDSNINHIPSPCLWTTHQKEICNQGLDDFLDDSNTNAFVIVRNDSILYEQYRARYAPDEPKIIFSITKVFITSLLAILLEEGTIKSLDQKVASFLPSFNLTGKKDISLRHLLQMTSGINHDEYRKLAKSVIIYYHPDLDKFMNKTKLEHQVGQQFVYKSIDTQILGRCMEEATGKSISDLLQEKIWNPLKMEHDGFFTLDRKNGNERMYGGMAVSSRDLLKIARLYLNNGLWDGKQIIPQDWVKTIENRATTNNKWWGYTNGWWLDTYVQADFTQNKDYFAAGYNGQVLYINPEDNIIILRQGKNKGGIKWYTALSHLGKLLGQNDPNKATLDILKNPELFSGVYHNHNNKTIHLSFDHIKQKWEAIIREDAESQTIKCHFHSPLVLTNFRKLFNLMFDVKNGAVKGLYLDKIKEKPLYFSKQNQE